MDTKESGNIEKVEVIKEETKKVKPIIFQKRDQDLLMDLYRLQWLDVEYLEKYIYKDCSKQFIYRRMNRLEAEDYIQTFRIPVMTPKPTAQSKNVYALAKRGALEVKALAGDVDWRIDIVNRTPQHVHHQLLVAHIKGTFYEDLEDEERVPKNENFEMVQYLSEKLGYFKFEPTLYPNYKGSDSVFTIRPDGVVILQNKKTGNCAPFMLELERSFQSKETTQEKLNRYNLYSKMGLYKEHRSYDYPVGKPRILFVSYSQKGIKRLINHSKEDYVDTSSLNGVLFTTYDQLVNDPYGKIFYGLHSTDPNALYSLTSKIE
ncbi:hypothetical protein COL23_25650 [Priestia aryabhattai]|uniref:replication-relaxation family protein n=1 Tax=Priestia aryabhattai TaxID=412384 RepID=UPI000BF2F411|nr:replication-relaxation family protein [Priestia aryabhattai]PFW72138.1 hypothetical protein COL23_25650 [Priestia aryabhattai]